MKSPLTAAAMMILLGSLAPAFAADEPAKKAETAPAKAGPAEKKAKIDQMADETLERLRKENPGAKDLLDKSAGYAVFDNKKVAFLVAGGGGVGVAVDKSTGKRTYMKMGTGGVGLGLGYKQYQVVLVFEKPEILSNFIEKGWKAETQAGAAAGTAGAAAGTTFTNGIAVYQFTEKGLMASADISGTKYWKDEDLNK